jgi:hypothetical protein
VLNLSFAPTAKNGGLWLLSVLLLAELQPLTAGALNRNDGALWRPRFALPAIVALDSPANRQFTAEIKAAPSATGWSVTISNDLRAWNCPVISAAYSTINRGTEPGWQLKATVPTNTPPELFTLVISCSEGVSVQVQSLSVAPAFASDFYVLHITDEQIVNEFHTDPSGQYWHMVGTWEEMKWMQEPVNLIHPRFVIITGDQIDFNGALDGWNNWVNWGYAPREKRLFTLEDTITLENRLSNMYKDCHRGYRVPYVEAPGNHDVAPANKVLLGSNIRWHPISAGIYEEQFGQRSYSFRMGDFYVLMHDWTDAALKKWAAGDYRASLADPTVKYRLIGQHFNTDQALLPNACDLMLIGHGHTTATAQSTPYYIYEDGPSFKYGTTGFFNFRRNPNGWTCDQTVSPRNTAKDIWPLFTANGITKKVRSNPPDAMNLRTNTVTIINDLPEEFYDGRVRFLLPKGNYPSANNGVVLAQYDVPDATRTAVLVRVDIPASGSITVSIPTGQGGSALRSGVASPQ